MLYPKKVKFRKWQTRRKNLKKMGAETRGTTLAFGSYGLKSLGYARIRSNQIEASRKVITRTTRKVGKLWIRIFPDRPFTSKPAEVKMGKGKGAPVGFCVEVKPGRILFEIDGVSREVAKETLRKAGSKMPVRTRIVERIHK